jgi:hypothetical protein
MIGYRLQKANQIANRRFKELLNSYSWFYDWVYQKDHRVFYVGSIERQFGYLRKTPTPCSCFGCGNSREYEGATINELRQIDDEVI